MASIEPALNVIYLADSGITGKGNPWLRLPSYAAKKANESVIADLKNRYKGTVWEEILPGGVEIVNNRLRSYVASYVYGGLIPDVGGSEFLNNTLHAVPIATIAFGEAYEEAIMITHKLRLKGIVPRYYHIDVLNAFDFRFHDAYTSYSLEKVEEMKQETAGAFYQVLPNEPSMSDTLE